MAGSLSQRKEAEGTSCNHEMLQVPDMSKAAGTGVVDSCRSPDLDDDGLVAEPGLEVTSLDGNSYEMTQWDTEQWEVVRLGTGFIPALDRENVL